MPGRQVDKFVAVGTICAYPKFTPVPFREEDLWNGYPEETNAPYGLAKKMLLVQSQAYRQQYGFNSIFLLPVNLYGPGDNFDPETSHVIPALIRKCVEARNAGEHAIEVWGDGSPTREFLYVEDAAEGIRSRPNGNERSAGQSGHRDGNQHQGSGRHLRLTGFHGKSPGTPTNRTASPAGASTRWRAETLFGFRAQTPFEEGLRLTIPRYEAAWNKAGGRGDGQ